MTSEPPRAPETPGYPSTSSAVSRPPAGRDPSSVADELTQQIRRFIDMEQRDVPTRFGPIERPDRWSNMSDHQRDWLASKSPSELERLDALLSLDAEKIMRLVDDYNAAQSIGRFGKWLALVIGGIFATSYTAVKLGIDLFGWTKGVPK